MAKKKKSSTPGVKSIVKKAISLKVKLGIAGFILTILISLFALAGMVAMFFSISGILSQSLWSGGKEAEIPEDSSCPCGCIWVGGEGSQNAVVQVGDGTSGFIAGPVDKSNVDSQVLKLIEIINSKLGDTKVPPNLIYGIANVEAGIDDLKNVYSNGETDIFNSVMKPLSGAQYYAGGELKKGAISKPSASGAKMIGPFQIHASYYDSWVKLCPEDILTAAGGSNPTDITNRGNTGQPLYLPDVVYGHMLNASYKWSELNEFLGTRYSDWESQPQSVKDRMLTVWYCIGYHGGNRGLNHAKNNAVIFDYFYYFSKALEQNPELLSDVSDWGQAGKYSNVLVNTIISKVDSDDSKGLKAGFTSYAGEGSTSYLIDWAYGAKVIYLGSQKFKSAVQSTGGQLTSGTTNINVPGYGAGTGSITDTSGAGTNNLTDAVSGATNAVNQVIPTAGSLPARELPTHNHPDKSEEILSKFLVGSVASYELYGVYPSVMISQKIAESGWETTSSIPNNFYGIKADSSWTGKKGLYKTSEQSSDGKKYQIEAWFREYDTFDEGVLGHGEFLTANPRYAKHGVFTAKNGEEQIQAIRKAGYATALNYVANVTSIMRTENFQWFDNIENAKYYMQQKGLYENYLNLVSGIQSGRIKVHEKANISNLNNGVGVTDTNTSSGNGTGEDGTGHWVCACKWPCDLCHCHDGKTEEDKNKKVETGDNSNNGGSGSLPGPEGVSVDNFVETPGVGQGNWGGKTTEELCAGMSALNTLRPMFGTSGSLSGKGGSNTNFGDWRNSPFKVPYYSQNSSVKEEWGSLVWLNKSNCCAVNMYAHICSALQQRLINSAEMIIVMRHYGIINSGGALVWDVSDANKMLGTFGYRVTAYTRAQMDEAKWTELDTQLANNIPQGWRCYKKFASGSTHYLNIDAKINGKYKLAQTNNASNDKQLWDRDVIEDCLYKNGPAVYIISKK